jgi:hypothetical protein
MKRLDWKGWIAAGSLGFLALVVAWEAFPARWMNEADIRDRIPLVRANAQMDYGFAREQYVRGLADQYPDPVPSDREIEAKLRSAGNPWSLFR